MKKISVFVGGLMSAALMVVLTPVQANAGFVPPPTPRILGISAHMAHLEQCYPTFAPSDCEFKFVPSKVVVRVVDLPKGAVVKFQHKKKNGKWVKIKKVKVKDTDKKKYRKVRAPIGKHRVVVLADGEKIVSRTVTVLGAR